MRKEEFCNTLAEDVDAMHLPPHPEERPLGRVSKDG
jgi:hypothetical protein